MKKLSFKLFLRRYLADMSNTGTLSLKKLEEECKSNTRLLELTALYLLLDSKKAKLLRDNKITFPHISGQFLKAVDKYQVIDGSFSDIEKYSDFDMLKKTYKSYLAEINNDSRLKALYCEKIIELKEKKRISNYRLYKDLSLNHGNVNDFLKNKSLKKMSFKNVKAMLAYCNNF